MEPAAPTPPAAAVTRRDRTLCFYLAVIAAVVAGALAGGFAPDGFGKSLKPLGDGFVALIRMMISPVIFCTILRMVTG